MTAYLGSLSQINRVILRSGCAVSLSFLFACGSATVTTQYAARKIVKPDRVLVYEFAVTAEDVDLDRGLGPMVLRHVDSQPQSNEEVQVGRVVARALADQLVQELRQKGINAERATLAAPPGRTTASIKGRFERIDQGDRTMRTMIGFGLGASHLRTHVQIYQGAGPSLRLVAEAETSIQSNLKPGLGPMLGLGAVTGGLAVAGAVGGATTMANEAVFATVKHDAKRTATQIAERIDNYYRRQGWLY